MNDNNVQRRLLFIGGFVWLATGCLGWFASTVVNGINPVVLVAPFVIGAFLLFLAIKDLATDASEAKDGDVVEADEAATVDEHTPIAFPAKKPA